MKISVGVSNRHIHLTENDYKVLCADIDFKKIKDINQPGQYATDMTFTIKTDKAEISNVRLLGPLRSYTQVEISKTDSYKLGINPPVRSSGDIIGSCPITIIGPKGILNIKEGCIISDRHIHVDDEIIKKYNLEDKETVSIKINGEKSGIISDVHLKKSDKAFFELHIDTDDANAFLLKQGDIVEIIED